jgi:hypothetical protein
MSPSRSPCPVIIVKSRRSYAPLKSIRIIARLFLQLLTAHRLFWIQLVDARYDWYSTTALPCIVKGRVNPYPTVRPIAKCQVFLIMFNKPARLRHDVQPLSGLAREGSCSVLVAHTSVLRRRCHTSALSSAAILMNISLFRRASLLR